MARIRSIHPSLFTDEAWVACTPLARVLYIGLLTDADDQGLVEWKPLQIKMRLLAGDNTDVAALLGELVAVNLVAELESAGKRLGAIRKFARFQRPKKPNAVFVLPREWRTYVGLDGGSSEAGAHSQHDSSELDADHEGSSSELDPDQDHQVPPKSELRKQMEDGGDNKEPPKPPRGRSRSDVGRREYPADFEVAWAAYPHHPGRSSKPDTLAEWRRLPPEERSGLVGAIVRFTPNVESACGGKGAPCMARWLKHGKHLNWTESVGQPATALGLEVQAYDPWPSRIREFKRNAYWNRLDWGPPPGKPGCTLSPETLIANGYVPTAQTQSAA
jgi:hypothetical protein